MENKNLRILFFTIDHEDYLADSILHGLKSLYDNNVVDYPKNELLYNDCPKEIRDKVRGKGFTLYFMLNPENVNRSYIIEDLKLNKFDLIIFPSIHRQFGIFYQVYHYLNRTNTIVIDGQDSPDLFPYNGFYFRRPVYWFLPRAHKKFLYFKREITEETLSYRYYKLLPKSIISTLAFPKKLRKVSFSIPEEKIIKELPEKSKLFTKHIVDKEIADRIPDASSNYVFNSEDEYYNDIKKSKFGITTKRGGWDCLRHYEIAANGAVICFKDLDKKPLTCAPHGLDQTNCIIYKNYEDLMRKIKNLTKDEYDKIQKNCWEWVKKNTTIESVKYILYEFYSWNNSCS